MNTILTSLLFLSTFLYPQPENPLVGTWQHPEVQGLTIVLEADMSYGVDGDGDGIMDVTGTYEIEEQTIKLHDKSGANACTDADGVYTFTVEVDKIRFEKKEDSCTDRAEALDGVTWKKQ